MVAVIGYREVNQLNPTDSIGLAKGQDTQSDGWVWRLSEEENLSSEKLSPERVRLLLVFVTTGLHVSLRPHLMTSHSNV